MRIAVIGLGLIGGSLCRAFKAYQQDIVVLGADRDTDTLAKALSAGVIDSILGSGQIDADIVFVALHPKAAIDYIIENASNFKKGCIVTDVCGIKKAVTDACAHVLAGYGVHFVGGHPMAGRETWGFDSSDAQLFKGASYILTLPENGDIQALDTVKNIVQQYLGCKAVVTDDKQHDDMIAYTSQLAHIVSSAYIKSPAASLQEGYTGGSFQDLTRVAHLDERLWTELFLYNRQSLLREFDVFMDNMQKYRAALNAADTEQLMQLLKDGREIKGMLSSQRKGSNKQTD